MDQFPGNSKRPERAERVRDRERDRDEPKKIERVVQGEVSRRKVSRTKRFTQNVIGGDTQSVWSYVVGEVLIPAGQDMFLDAVKGGFERLIYGESSGPRSRSRGRGGHRDGYVSYNSISSRSRGGSRDEPRRELSRHARSSHNFDEILLKSRVEAEEVLDRMDDMIDRYDHVSVAEFYELCGVDSNFTERKWGWTDISGAGVSRIRSGDYVINLPRPEPID